jgi:outer membrane biogenesis lipoprotein LolB
MGKILVPALAILLLTGCSRWDEAQERAGCEKLFPGDHAKANECYAKNKLAYDSGGAQGAEGARR